MGTFLDSGLHGARLSLEALECLGVCWDGGEIMSGYLDNSSSECSLAVFWDQNDTYRLLKS